MILKATKITGVGENTNNPTIKFYYHDTEPK